VLPRGLPSAQGDRASQICGLGLYANIVLLQRKRVCRRVLRPHHLIEATVRQLVAVCVMTGVIVSASFAESTLLSV